MKMNSDLLSKSTLEGTKHKTIEELKATERRKPEALSSLKDKLSDLSSGLLEDERAVLAQLLGSSNSGKYTPNNATLEQTVYSKPQQAHLPDDELEKVVFSKPQQAHLPDDELEKVVFSKPQQAHLPDHELSSVIFKKK